MSLVVSLHVLIAGEIMASIIAMSLVNRIALHRTGLNFKKKGIVIQVVVAEEEAILVVVGIIKAKGIVNGTSLE